MLEAILFDLDGTIVDTESAEFEAWRRIYLRHGGHLPPSTWAKVVGQARGRFDPAHHLEEQLARPLAKDVLHQLARAEFRLLLARRRLRPGVRDLVRQAAAAGIRLAVATSSSRLWAEAMLRAYGLREAFAVLAGADEVARAKPAPDLYELALRRLDLAPQAALAIEDSPSGVLAARAAGLAVLLVPNRLTARLPFPAGALRRPTLRGIRLEELRTLLGEAQPVAARAHERTSGRDSL